MEIKEWVVEFKAFKITQVLVVAMHTQMPQPLENMKRIIFVSAIKKPSVKEKEPSGLTIVVQV